MAWQSTRVGRAAAAIRIRAITAATHACWAATSASRASCRLKQRFTVAAGLVAETFGLADRGQLEVGRAGDLVVFDPTSVIDEATFLDPRRFPTGIEHVLVNGTPV